MQCGNPRLAKLPILLTKIRARWVGRAEVLFPLLVVGVAIYHSRDTGPGPYQLAYGLGSWVVLVRAVI